MNIVHEPNDAIEHLASQLLFSIHVVPNVGLANRRYHIQRYGPFLPEPPAAAHALIELFVAVIDERDDVGTVLEV